MLNIKYKGSRNYVHGSDIYNEIVRSLSGQFGGHLSRLVFRRVARNQILLLLDRPLDSTDVIGVGTWSTATEGSERFWLRETAEPILGSSPFDEEAITIGACVFGESIQGGRSNAYTSIENIIALTKRLNYSLSPNVDGKWLFGQLDLNQPLPSAWETIQITRTIAVANNFSRNRITLDGVNYGEIRFIGGKP